MEHYFALFFDSDTVIWSFNAQDKLFQENTLRLVKAFQMFGYDFYGGDEGVASVLLDTPSNENPEDLLIDGLVQRDELFIVTFGKRYTLLVSNVQVTTRMIPDVPNNINDLIRSVLVGQGSILYANLMSKAQNEKEELEVDRLYRTILRSVTSIEDIDILVKDRRCSLSPLSLKELIFFHSKLRKFFLGTSLAEKQRSWSLLFSIDGNFATLDYQATQDIAILAGLLSALVNFCFATLNVKPAAIIFGGINELDQLYFFNGKKYSLVASQPRTLFRDPYFEFLLMKLPQEYRYDVSFSINHFLQEATSDSFNKAMTERTLEELMTIYNLLNGKTAVSPMIAPITLHEIPGIGKKREHYLRKHKVATIRDLLELNTNYYPKWVEKVANNARSVLNNRGGWQISWTKTKK